MKQVELPSGARMGVQFWGAPFSGGDIPLVLLHGFCEDARIWADMTPYLGDIPGLSVDLPGFGHSALPEKPDMASYARMLDQTLAALEINRCILVGHSLGGYVALEYASGFARRLAGLGLFHSHPFEDDETRKNNRMRGIEMIESGKKELYVAQLFPSLFTPAFNESGKDVVNSTIEKGKQQPSRGIIAALQAMMNRHDHQNTLLNAPCPVMFLLGVHDSLVPIANAWKTALLPGIADISVLPEVAHMGMLEAPEASAVAVEKFYQLAATFVPG